jgi:Ca-activated chloride channel family protein
LMPGEGNLGSVVRVIAGIGCVVLMAIASAPSNQEPAPHADFNVDVNLVELNVSVSDRGGRIVGDLPQSAFQVFEDGVAQQIRLFRREDAPVAVGLVVDNSGSMQRKLEDVVAAAGQFARSSNPQDQMFVIHFNEHVSPSLPAGQPFVSDPELLQAAMATIHARGQTALYDAIAASIGHVRESSLQKKVLIVLSDGGDNASTRRLDNVIGILQESNVIVYTVGLFDEYDHDRNPGVLRRLAKISGGESFFPKQISDATATLQAVSRDIRNQYTIGYVPSNQKADGSYREVHVKLTGPHSDRWVARTRTGYVAGAEKTQQ